MKEWKEKRRKWPAIFFISLSVSAKFALLHRSQRPPREQLYARPAPGLLEGGPAPRFRGALEVLCSAPGVRSGPRQGRCGDAEAARGKETRGGDDAKKD